MQESWITKYLALSWFHVIFFGYYYMTPTLPNANQDAPYFSGESNYIYLVSPKVKFYSHYIFEKIGTAYPKNYLHDFTKYFSKWCLSWFMQYRALWFSVKLKQNLRKWLQCKITYLVFNTSIWRISWKILMKINQHSELVANWNG